MAAGLPVDVQGPWDEELKKVEPTLDKIILGINEAWERANQFFTMVTKKRDDLIKKCNAYREEFRAEMRKIEELQTVKVGSVSSVKDSIGKGGGAVLEGQTLFVHDSLRGRLQDFLASAKREDSEKAKEIARRVACLSFTPYRLDSEHILGELSVINEGCLEKRLGGGDEPSLNQWRLKKVKEVPFPDRDLCSLAATSDGMMVVGFSDGVVEVLRANGTMVRSLCIDAPVQCVAVLGDGSYVVRKVTGGISLYSRTSGKIKTSMFQVSGPCSGLDVDGCDRIYACCANELYEDDKHGEVKVFHSEGGDPIRTISVDDEYMYKPRTVCTMNHSEMLVLSDGYVVRVVDQFKNDFTRWNKVMREVSKKGFGARVAVLHDDNILIGWWKAGRVNIDLYTNQLKLVRRVLADYQGYVHAIRELSTGEIAVCARDRIDIFCRHGLI